MKPSLCLENNVILIFSKVKGGLFMDPALSSWCPRKEAVFRLKHFEDRDRALTADFLLHTLVSARCGSGHYYDFYGCPQTTGMHISASHDGQGVLAAISSSTIGVDLVDARRNSSFIECFLHDNEQKLVDSVGILHDKHVMRMQLWAVREAFLKCLGIGLSIYPGHLSVYHSDARKMSSDCIPQIRFSSHDLEIMNAAIWWVDCDICQLKKIREDIFLFHPELIPYVHGQCLALPVISGELSGDFIVAICGCHLLSEPPRF